MVGASQLKIYYMIDIVTSRHRVFPVFLLKASAADPFLFPTVVFTVSALDRSRAFLVAWDIWISSQMSFLFSTRSTVLSRRSPARIVPAVLLPMTFPAIFGEI